MRNYLITDKSRRYSINSWKLLALLCKRTRRHSLNCDLIAGLSSLASNLRHSACNYNTICVKVESYVIIAISGSASLHSSASWDCDWELVERRARSGLVGEFTENMPPAPLTSGTEVLRDIRFCCNDLHLPLGLPVKFSLYYNILRYKTMWLSSRGCVEDAVLSRDRSPLYLQYKTMWLSSRGCVEDAVLSRDRSPLYLQYKTMWLSSRGCVEDAVLSRDRSPLYLQYKTMWLSSRGCVEDAVLSRDRSPLYLQYKTMWLSSRGCVEDAVLSRDRYYVTSCTDILHGSPLYLQYKTMWLSSRGYVEDAVLSRDRYYVTCPVLIYYTVLTRVTPVPTCLYLPATPPPRPRLLICKQGTSGRSASDIFNWSVQEHCGDKECSQWYPVYKAISPVILAQR
ncbi:hypothetical protein J6590_012516 [Homalodisca vitripennis]|nr:hypothetical protein J6590_012516 [Homalodisca vitripennis]